MKSLLLLCFLLLDVQRLFSYLAWPAIIFKVGLFLEPSLGSRVVVHCEVLKGCPLFMSSFQLGAEVLQAVTSGMGTRVFILCK